MWSCTLDGGADGTVKRQKREQDQVSLNLLTRDDQHLTWVTVL